MSILLIKPNFRMREVSMYFFYRYISTRKYDVRTVVKGKFPYTSEIRCKVTDKLVGKIVDSLPRPVTRTYYIIE